MKKIVLIMVILALVFCGGAEKTADVHTGEEDHTHEGEQAGHTQEAEKPDSSVQDHEHPELHLPPEKHSQ